VDVIAMATVPTIQQGDADARPFTLLVAVDETDSAHAALAPTARLARATDARVVLVNVVRASTDLGCVAAECDAALEFVTVERRMYLSHLARHLCGIDVETRMEVVLHGEHIEQRIARVAEELAADMVIVVGHDQSSTTDVEECSTAHGIVQSSPCPVLIVSPAPEAVTMVSSTGDSAG